MIGQTISHYRITEKLCGSGMEAEYQAEDGARQRTVAPKHLPTELTRNAEARRRFRHEASAANTCAKGEQEGHKENRR